MITPTPVFNVLILYDNARSGACAAAVYERLLQNLEPDYQFQMQSWRFSMLTLPSVALWAKRDVKAADMVIVAWGGDSSEIESIKPWLDDWPIASLDSRRALVSLFTGPEPTANDQNRLEADAILQNLAERAGMDLISSISPPSDNLATPASDEVFGLPTLMAQPDTYPAELVPVAAAMSQPGFHHGGINE